MFSGWYCHWYAGGAAAVAFLQQWTTVHLTMVVAVEAVAARQVATYLLLHYVACTGK
jgi:hypothetical protein